MVDELMPKIERLIEGSGGWIGADRCTRGLRRVGFAGTDRTTRLGGRRVKESYQAGYRRVFRPWIPEPGLWMQWDWGDGPKS